MRAAKWAAICAGAVCLACALYVAFWYFMAERLRDSALVWVDERRGDGFEVGFRQLDIGGFPWRLDMIIDDVTFAAPKSPARWGWQGERVRASMRPWRLGKVTIEAPGSHAFVFAANGSVRFLQGQALGLNAVLTFGRHGISPVEVHVADLTLKDAQSGEVWSVDRARLDATRPTGNSETPNAPSLEVRLRMGDFGVPARLNLPLGPDWERLEISAGLVGEISDGSAEDALGRWRDDGGVIQVQRLSLAYGPLSMTAEGTIALDGALQPVGSLTARMEGFFETVDALRTRGLIKVGDAITAKMVLGVMTRRSASGRASLTLPLSVQDRRLFVGPLPLAEIPEVIW